MSFDLTAIRAALAGREPRREADAQHRAAVAAVLRAPAHPEVLLIRRAEHPLDPWSGHMAFPGGRRDPRDRDLLDTALRETREEVGIDLGRDARLLGRLDDVPAVAKGRLMGMAIAPFVFELGDPTAEARANEEVQEVLWAPLDPLMRGEADTTIAYPWEGEPMQLPAFDVRGRIVWGLTYQMLQLLFRAVREER
jgi:8-oxo-dGTP pyrophosphatase MutT (NUDIX family)